jgi:hypothetical protein
MTAWKKVVIIADPNGAGKPTFAQEMVQFSSKKETTHEQRSFTAYLASA